MRSSVSGIECLLMRVYAHISMCVCESVCAGVQANSMEIYFNRKHDSRKKSVQNWSKFKD